MELKEAVFIHNFSNGSLETTSSLFSYHAKQPTPPELFVGLVILVLAAVGNTLVLMIIYGKSFKRRRTPHDILIGNLSVSDLAFSAICIVENFFPLLRSQAFCATFSVLSTATLVMSMFTLATMADFRRRIILNPFSPKPTKRCLLITLACLWLGALLIAVPLAAVTREERAPEKCPEDWPSPLLNKIYTVFLAIVMYVVPIAVTIISYAKIIIYLKEHIHRIHHLHQLKRASPRREDQEVMKASIILIFLYTTLTLPHQIAWILIVFGCPVGVSMQRYTNIPVYAQSLCDPFVYGVITSRFRRGFAHYLCSLHWRWYRVDFAESHEGMHHIPENIRKSLKAAPVRLLRLQLLTTAE